LSSGVFDGAYKFIELCRHCRATRSRRRSDNPGITGECPPLPSPDAIAEFRVQTNSNNSEFGRYSGGVINISSRSGTNAFHGSAYEYFRNDKLNATNFFANANNTGKPAFKQNQYGLTGRLRSDRRAATGHGKT